jgi:hypothetical protein
MLLASYTQSFCCSTSALRKALLAAAFVFTQFAQAQTPTLGKLEINVSPITLHYSPSPEHRRSVLVGLQKVEMNGSLKGMAYFTNSFGQPSVYAFTGRKYLQPWGYQRFYWQWTAGVIYGYVDPYEDKVPLNWHGFAPVIIPALGYQLTERSSLQITALGNSALMLNWSFNWR